MTSSHKDIRLEQLMPLIREQLAAGKKVTFGPKGTSMLPLLRQGIDSVELSPVTRPLKKYDLPLYQRENGQYVLHRIVKEDESFTCVGDNQFELEAGVKPEQLIAVASGFYRAEKYISVSSLRYRLYCRFWHWTRPIRKKWPLFNRLLKGLLQK